MAKGARLPERLFYYDCEKLGEVLAESLSENNLNFYLNHCKNCRIQFFDQIKKSSDIQHVHNMLYYKPAFANWLAERISAVLNNIIMFIHIELAYLSYCKGFQYD